MDFDRDFGINQVFVEDLYEAWRQNPIAVDETWDKYFTELSGGSFQARNGKANGSNGAGGHASTNGANGNGTYAYTNGNGALPQAVDLRGMSVPPPAQSVGSQAMPFGDRRKSDRGAKAVQGVSDLIEAYRSRGHLFAQIDPLGQRTPPPGDELAIGQFGLIDADLDHSFATGDIPELGDTPLRELIARLQKTYTGTIGVEYMHCEDPAIRAWLQQRMEPAQNQIKLTHEEKIRVLERLTDGETLETFLHKRFGAYKRFSLEGGESLIPAMDWMLEDASARGVDEIVIGMAHRGRLNVLANILGKRTGEIFTEFEDRDAQELIGRGDVKYHMGYSGDRTTRAGKKMHLSLAFNPSHLEIVNPVVEGRVRAKQDRLGRDPERRKVMPVLIHGDAALSGQGPVAETLNFAGLEGYKTGGTLHIVINNQIGFTTNPEDDRSTPYCTDLARAMRVPVFHVNGEDPEAVVWVTKLAVEFRQTFQQDVFIDLVCYRKWGHNEQDEPAFTQPLMYEIIRKKDPPRAIYARHLVAEGAFTEGEANALVARAQEKLEAELEHTRSTSPKRVYSAMAGLWSRYKGGPESQIGPVHTAVSLEKLRELLRGISRVPQGFSPHEKIQALLNLRAKLSEPGAENAPFDWGVGEHLAFASLLDEGSPIRFSGQDARRGTFSHRHAAVTDIKTGKRFVPLDNVAKKGARIDIFDSPLSEAAVVGFDYGFSLDAPDWLTCWEAQFGDFVNGAQVLIDQFISSAEDKWLRLSGLVMLLPHGFEGQGPEHSSARLERFLQLAAEDNIQVCNLTTPAQFFHVLRRQVVSPWRKPLVVMTPKSLLRHKGAVSTLLDLSDGGFQRVIPDEHVKGEAARKILLCSGKVYYDLLAAREAKKIADVAIIRVEQLYPFPETELTKALSGYKPGTEALWVQEEPWNMGAWYFIHARWPQALGAYRPTCAARVESASPATGSGASHKFEQQLLMDQALS